MEMMTGNNGFREIFWLFSDETKDATKDATQTETKQVSPTGGDSTGGGDGMTKDETHDTDGKVSFRSSQLPLF